MSVPAIGAPPTQERMNVERNQQQIARNLLLLVENLIAFDEFIKGVPSDPEALLEPPYEFTEDEAYALRLWAEKGALYAALLGAGGTLSAADATQLEDLSRRSAGVMLFVNQGF